VARGRGAAYTSTLSAVNGTSRRGPPDLAEAWRRGTVVGQRSGSRSGAERCALGPQAGRQQQPARRQWRREGSAGAARRLETAVRPVAGESPEGPHAAPPELQPPLLQKSPAPSEISPGVRRLPAQAAALARAVVLVDGEARYTVVELDQHHAAAAQIRGARSKCGAGSLRPALRAASLGCVP